MAKSSWSWDRVWGIIFSIALPIFAVVAIALGYRIWLVLLLTLLLAAWDRAGWKNVNIGWKAVFTLFGERTEHLANEGSRWAPWPLGLVDIDCRLRAVKLDSLLVYTKDGTRIDVEGSVFFEIVDVGAFLGVDPAAVTKGLDDILDEEIRIQVTGKTLDEVLDDHVDIKEKIKETMEMRAVGANGFIPGVRIIGVPVNLIPDPEVMKARSLAQRETYEKEGQKIEIQHFADMMVVLMTPSPKANGVFEGLTREQAYEQLQIEINKVSKNIEARAFSFDPATIAAINALIDSRRSI